MGRLVGSLSASPAQATQRNTDANATNFYVSTAPALDHEDPEASGFNSASCMRLEGLPALHFDRRVCIRSRHHRPSALAVTLPLAPEPSCRVEPEQKEQKEPRRCAT